MVSKLAVENVMKILQEVLQCPDLHIKPQYRDLNEKEMKKIAKELAEKLK